MADQGGDQSGSPSPHDEPLTSREEQVARMLESIGEQLPPVVSQTDTRVLRMATRQTAPGWTRTIGYIGSRDRPSDPGRDSNGNDHNNNSSSTTAVSDTDAVNDVSPADRPAEGPQAPKSNKVNPTASPAPKTSNANPITPSAAEANNINPNPDTRSTARPSEVDKAAELPEEKKSEHAVFVCASQRPRYDYVPASDTTSSLGESAPADSAYAISCAREGELRLTPTRDFVPAYDAQPISQLRQNLHPLLVENLRSAGYQMLYVNQITALAMLSEPRTKSLHIPAPIGAGKTLAYLLPIINNRVSDIHQGPEPACSSHGKHTVVNERVYTSAIIIVPNAEMAAVVFHTTNQLIHRSAVRVAAVYPGVSQDDQMSVLLQGADLIVGTLGRLQHFIDSEVVGLSAVKYVVLDDADKLAGAYALGLQRFFRSASLPSSSSYRIVSTCATFGRVVAEQIKTIIPSYGDATAIQAGIHDGELLNSDHAMAVIPDDEDKKEGLLQILMEKSDGIDISKRQLLIFTTTKKSSEAVGKFLLERTLEPHELFVYNSDRKARQREEALERFRNNDLLVLVATQDLARGLNFKHLRQIVHFDIPAHLREYYYASGRVGRLGHQGTVVSLVQGVGGEEQLKLQDDLNRRQGAQGRAQRRT